MYNIGKENVDFISCQDLNNKINFMLKCFPKEPYLKKVKQ